MAECFETVVYPVVRKYANKVFRDEELRTTSVVLAWWFWHMAKTRKRFGDQLRELRENAGLSQAELSRRSGCRRASVSEIEAGKQQPTWETAVRLVEACGGTIEIRTLR